jgi:hypothetical protein
VLSAKDHAGMAEVLAAARKDPRLAHLEPVGWYHSHTRSEIFLSDKDLEIHQRYVPAAWQVALVLRPAALEPTRAGFFFREKDGSIISSASCGEFVIAAPRPGAKRPAAAHFEQPLRAEPDAIVAAVEAPVVADQPQAAPVAFEGFSTVTIGRGIPRSVVIAVLVLAAVAGGFAHWEVRRERDRLIDEVRKLRTVNQTQAGRLLLLEQQLKTQARGTGEGGAPSSARR